MAVSAPAEPAVPPGASYRSSHNIVPIKGWQRLGFQERSKTTGAGLAASLVAIIGAIISGGCAVRQTIHVPRANLPPPPVETSADDLVARLLSQQQAVRTMTATVNLSPTAGSAYSGVIKQYHDVRAFILLKAPDRIRMVGQAPVVRTTIFDMASDGEEFKLLIPPKGKFIEGSTEAGPPAKNSLENLRPQHILEALLVPAVDSGREQYFPNQEEEEGRLCEVLNVVSGAPDQLRLKRKVWFDAATLEVSRLEFYDLRGALAEDVRYAAYEDYNGVRYPSHIQLSRPAEDYTLGIVIEKASFNQPIPAEKFVLQRPANVELIRLSERPSGEAARGE
jgi:hypothetical protein